MTRIGMGESRLIHAAPYLAGAPLSTSVTTRMGAADGRYRNARRFAGLHRIGLLGHGAQCATAKTLGTSSCSGLVGLPDPVGRIAEI